MGIEPTTTCLASKSSTTELPPHMVIREGLKPSTSRFVAECSIQLSYLILEFPSRVELDSQGFAVLRVTVSLREHWLGIKDSNLGHPDSESGVLPTELIPNGDFDGSRSRDLRRDRPALSQLSYEANVL